MSYSISQRTIKKAKALTASGDDGVVTADHLVSHHTLRKAKALLAGGDSSAERRARAKLQRRDRYGKFAEMGGGFSFNLKLGDGKLRRVSGIVVGQSGDEDVDVEIVDSDTLVDGVYSVPSQKGEAVKAILSDKALKGVDKSKIKDIVDDVFIDIAELRTAKKQKKQKPEKQEKPEKKSKTSKNPFRRSNKISQSSIKNPVDAALGFADEQGMLDQRSIPKGNLVIDPLTGKEIKISSQKIANEFVKNGGALNEVPDVYVIKAVESNAFSGGRFNIIGEGGGVNGMTRMIDRMTGAYIGVKYSLGESTSFTASESNHIPKLYKEALNEMFSELIAEEFGYEPTPMRLVKSKNGEGVSLITELAQNRWGKIDTPQNPATWNQVDGSLLADPFSYMRMKMFDSLIGNIDRHPGNYMLKKKSDGTYELIPIDHSLVLMQVHADKPIHKVNYYEELDLIDYNASQDESKWEEMVDSVGDLLEDLRGVDPDVLEQKLNRILDHLETMFPNEELYQKDHRQAEIDRLVGTVKNRINAMTSMSPEELYEFFNDKRKGF